MTVQVNAAMLLQPTEIVRFLDTAATGDPVMLAQVLWTLTAMLSQPLIHTQLASHPQVWHAQTAVRSLRVECILTRVQIQGVLDCLHANFEGRTEAVVLLQLEAFYHH